MSGGPEGGTPAHLVLGPPTHGVTRYAAQLADWSDAPLRRAVTEVVPGERVHLHLTDRVVAPTPAAAADVVADLAARARLTVTLHDVPQPTDGAAFERRAAAYRRVVAAAEGWVVSSAHERGAVERWCDPPTPGGVVPLPVVPLAGGSGATGGVADAALAPPAVGVADAALAPPAVGVFGFVYPGKGHAEVLAAVAGLRAAGRDVGAVFLGAPATGHEDDLAGLVRRADELGVPLAVTGAVPEEGLAAALRSVAAAVVGHRNVSASGSLNSWLAAGRRPLVRDGAYAREMAALRPGTLTTYRDEGLVAALAAALDAAPGDPASTWLGPDADLRPGPAEVVAAYRAWWAGVRASEPA